MVQIGTPAELFERPAHTFVGYFIGSPGMNVLPARIEGNRAYVDGCEIVLAQGYPELPGYAEIGVRPEYAGLAEGGEGLPIEIRRIEDVGSHQIVRADFRGREISVVVPEECALSDRLDRVMFEPAAISVYVDGWRVEGEAV